MPSAPTPVSHPGPTGTSDVSLLRSGAVARLLGMPVATLRVWERRYGLTQPRLSPGGQRLYSGADVRRLVLVKQLTDLGHAIGSLASLDLLQLQHVALTDAQVRARTRSGAQTNAVQRLPGRPWRLAVVGAALARRLQRPGLLRRLGRPVVLLGPFDDAAQAAATLRDSDIDALLLHQPQLLAGWLDAQASMAPSLAQLPRAVLYGFAADAVCDALATAGTALLREPQPDAVLAQWLRGLCMAVPVPQRATDHPDQPAQPDEPVQPRRWDDAALTDFAGQASTLACECPRHVTELLTMLSHFESYSAGCADRNAADADLHGYLRQLAAESRARFETALEQVALHQGLLLPPSLPAPPKADPAPALALG